MEEARREAEEKLWTIARYANELTGHIPGLYLDEGESIPAITKMIEDDPSIHMLILANAPSGPGPLVSHFTGKAASKLNIPVMIVPGHLQDADIDKIA